MSNRNTSEMINSEISISDKKLKIKRSLKICFGIIITFVLTSIAYYAFFHF